MNWAKYLANVVRTCIHCEMKTQASYSNFLGFDVLESARLRFAYFCFALANEIRGFQAMSRMEKPSEYASGFFTPTRQPVWIVCLSEGTNEESDKGIGHAVLVPRSTGLEQRRVPCVESRSPLPSG